MKDIMNHVNHHGSSLVESCEQVHDGTGPKYKFDLGGKEVTWQTSESA